MDATDLKQCTMRTTIHLNGGSKFFGYVLVCNEHPRLQRIDKHFRDTKKTEIQYQVDGESVASLDEAAERLSVPPVITDEMTADMISIGPEFGDHRKLIAYSRLKKLENCGLLEWGARGECRIRQPASWAR